MHNVVSVDGFIADGTTMSGHSMTEADMPHASSRRYLQPDFRCLRCIRSRPFASARHIIYSGVSAAPEVMSPT
jgi:hypothetical protein